MKTITCLTTAAILAGPALLMFHSAQRDASRRLDAVAFVGDEPVTRAEVLHRLRHHAATRFSEVTRRNCCAELIGELLRNADLDDYTIRIVDERWLQLGDRPADTLPVRTSTKPGAPLPCL